MRMMTARDRTYVVLYTLALATLGTLAVMVVAVRPAKSDTITKQCQFGRTSAACTTTIIPMGTFRPHIQYAPQLTPGSDAEKAQQERIREWEERCVASIEPDDLGVLRYRYTHPACQHGVTP